MDRSHEGIRGAEGQGRRGAVPVGGRKDHEPRGNRSRLGGPRGKQLGERLLINVRESDQNRIGLGSVTLILLLHQLKPGPGQGSFQSGGTGGRVPHQKDLRASRLLDGLLDHAMTGSKWIS